jgi:hypothetical protein
MVREAAKQGLEHHGVVCLFCKTNIELPSTAPVKPHGENQVRLVRCPICQKEAPYRSNEIVDLSDAA